MRRRKTVRLAEQGGAQQAASQEYELRLRAAALMVALFFGAGLLVAAGLLAYSFTKGGAAPPPETAGEQYRVTVTAPASGQEPARAAIVDQLSLTAPNPAFQEAARDRLERAGYEVDYFPGELVTVDFYRELPTHGYDLIILRAHAGRTQLADGRLVDDAGLFTSEPYDATSHVEEQRDRRLTLVNYARTSPEQGEGFFGIPADFVRRSMTGDFDGATVILMGCDVLRGDRLAEAFVKKGAESVIGWDKPVTAGHTDAATLNLLEHFLFGGVSAREAAAMAMADVGRDALTDAELLTYPREE